MSDKISTIREFGKFRLDSQRRVLWFGDEPVRLPLKEIELLCVLTESGGEVVTKEEMLDKVWADSFVDESNLSRHIYVLRKTLKDLGEDEGLIQTVPRRGYRFAGEVREVVGGNGNLVIEKHTKSRALIEIDEGEDVIWRIPIASLLRSPAIAVLLLAIISGLGYLAYEVVQANTVAAPVKSIAVLPFDEIGSDPPTNAGIGLTDILITRLGSIREITVRPTSAILSFDPKTADPLTFGRDLQVEAILEGSIYRYGDKVRVTARMTRINDRSVIWTGHFEELRQDELRLQSEIALQVVNALALNLKSSEKDYLARRYTDDLDAYDLYLRGRFEWNKRSWQGALDARRLFGNAIERDPNFALAYSALAEVLATNTNWGEATLAVDKALELDPNLAEAHAALGFIETFHSWDWEKAEQSFKRSIELNRNYATAHHWYAQLLALRGRNDEARSEMRTALEIDPLSHNFLADLGQIYYFNREYKEAEALCQQALAVYSGFHFAHTYLADIFLKTGDHQRAVDSVITARRINETLNTQSLERQKARESEFDGMRRTFEVSGIHRFAERLITPPNESPSDVYLNAKMYALIGDKQRALDSLEKAYASKAFLIVFVMADPMFDNLRSEPRYQEVLRKMRLG